MTKHFMKRYTLQNGIETDEEFFTRYSSFVQCLSIIIDYINELLRTKTVCHTFFTIHPQNYMYDYKIDNSVHKIQVEIRAGENRFRTWVKYIEHNPERGDDNNLDIYKDLGYIILEEEDGRYLHIRFDTLEINTSILLEVKDFISTVEHMLFSKKLIPPDKPGNKYVTH